MIPLVQTLALAALLLGVADPQSLAGQGATCTAYRSQDGRGREAVVTWSGVPSELTQVARQYGPHDGLLGASETRSSGNVEVVYAYDDRFLVTSVTRGAEAVTYGYTASGERSWEQSPGGRTDYDYDGLHRLWHATSSRGSTEFVWEDGGTRLLAVKAPNLTECRRYDARGRLLWMDGRDPGVPCDSPAAAPIVRFDYGYDERGNRRTETYAQAGGPPELTQYGYDAADRLTSVISPNGAETTYGLLGDGSRNTVTTAVTQGGLGTTESYHYDARGGLTGITDEANQPVATFTVDPAGRVHSETRGGRSKTSTWDAGGRLTAASVTVDGSTTSSQYRYDHQGLRFWKQGPSGTTTYLWGAGELAEEVLPSGTRLRYERGAGLALAVGGETLLHDGLGSVVGRVGLGAPVIYRYDAWGSFQGTAGPGSGEASLAYAGQHWDADVGLSYAQQRWYSPEVGRFLSEDPVGTSAERLMQAGRLQTFAYAAGNPLLFIDPLGLDVGQPESTSARAQQNMRYQAGLNENNKERGTWVQGCAAGMADNWNNVDGGGMEAGDHSPEYLAGYVKCQGANLESYRNSDVARTTREFWQDSPVMGCALGGGNAIIPAGDISNLPPEMQETAVACQFGVGAATAVVTLGELGVNGVRAVKNLRPSPGPRTAIVTVGAEGRAALRGEGASAATKAPATFESRAKTADAGPPSAARAAPPANRGVSPRHGTAPHDARLRKVAESMKEKGWLDVRVNQQQVDAAGNVTGRNRPDVSGINPRTGQRVNIEVDTTASGSLRHQSEVPTNDPGAVNTFIRIDASGRPVSATTTRP